MMFFLTVFLFLLGLIVIIGWYTNNITLIKVLPNLGPMQYNTALGFILISASFFLSVLGKFNLSKILSCVILLMAGLTILQYIFEWNIGIDELFIKDNTTDLPYPGRMGFNTALCYIISGITLLNIKNKALSGVLGSFLFGIGIVAFIGYLVGIDAAYNWGHSRFMAIHTAFGFVITGTTFSVSSLLNNKFSGYEHNKTSDVWLYGYAISFGITIFLIDLSLPLGANIGLLYILLLLLSYFFKNKNAIFILAAISVGLLILGYALSIEMENKKWIGIANRSASVFVILFTTMLLNRIKNSNKKQKEAENKLVEFNANLEVLIAERTKELELSNQYLDVANKELEMFSYSVSHDLKAPLRALQGFSNNLVKKYSEQLDETGIRWLQFIKDNAERMDILIRDILTFSRIGRTEIKHEKIDMTSMVHELINQQKEFYRIPVELTIQKLPEGKGDPVMIKMLWQNLIENAFKYSSKNEKIKITIVGYENDGFNHYVITDNGVGFDMKYYDKIFGVFQRLHGNGDFEGTGVGLANVKRIIDKHKGEIRAESTLNKGSKFEFLLPKN